MPVPPSTTDHPRGVPFQQQTISTSFGGAAVKDGQSSLYSSQQGFDPNNRSQPYNQYYSKSTYQGGSAVPNWRDHLTRSSASTNSLPQNAHYNSISGKVPLSSKVPSLRPSSSLSSSSDQHSVGSGNRYPAPPPKPPKYSNLYNPTIGGLASSRSIIDPTNGDSSLNKDASEDEDESDWEKEISQQGDVFYVVPYMSSNTKLDNKCDRISDLNNDDSQSKSKDTSVNSANKNSKKLSRLVRRRESKRDRGTNLGGSGGSPKVFEKTKTSEKSSIGHDDNSDSHHKSISLLPGGINPLQSTGFAQTNNR